MAADITYSNKPTHVGARAPPTAFLTTLITNHRGPQHQAPSHYQNSLQYLSELAHRTIPHLFHCQQQLQAQQAEKTHINTQSPSTNPTNHPTNSAHYNNSNPTQSTSSAPPFKGDTTIFTRPYILTTSPLYHFSWIIESTMLHHIPPTQPINSHNDHQHNELAPFVKNKSGTNTLFNMAAIFSTLKTIVDQIVQHKVGEVGKDMVERKEFFFKLILHLFETLNQLTLDTGLLPYCINNVQRSIFIYSYNMLYHYNIVDHTTSLEATSASSNSVHTHTNNAHIPPDTNPDSVLIQNNSQDFVSINNKNNKNKNAKPQSHPCDPNSDLLRRCL